MSDQNKISADNTNHVDTEDSTETSPLTLKKKKLRELDLSELATVIGGAQTRSGQGRTGGGGYRS